ncbi:MAG: hypothetical protein WD669_03770 [Pirellulales bacterium]
MDARQFVFVIVIVSLASGENALGQNAAADTKAGDVPPKPARSQFEAGEFREYTSQDLTRPQPSGPQGAGHDLRTLQGQLVDHLGQPIPDVFVSIHEQIGYENPASVDNFDKTDQLGRFILRSSLLKDRVEVRRGNEAVWNQTVEPGQTTMKIVWPKPSPVRLEIDRKLLLAGKEFSLTTPEFWTDMSPLHIPRVQSHEGVTTFNWLLPGTYRVLCPKRIKVGGFNVERSVTIAEFTVREGEEQAVRAGAEPGIEITNSVPKWGNDDPAQKRGAYVEIETVKTRYHDVSALVDIAAVDGAGRFRARVWRPGQYVLRVSAVAAPPVVVGEAEVAAGAVFGEIPAANAFSATPSGRIRFEVKEGAKVVDVTPSERPAAVSPTVQFVHGQLESQAMTVSYARYLSGAGGKASTLAAYEDHAGVANELFRVLNEPNSPYDWRRNAYDTLARMTEHEGVVERLMALWDVPHRRAERHDVLNSIENPKRNAPQVIDWVEKRTNEPNLRWRSIAYHMLVQIAGRYPEHRQRIGPIMIRGLADPYPDIRSQAVGTMEWFDKSQTEGPARAMLADPDMAVRLRAGRSVWRITGDSGPFLRVATELLSHDNLELRSEAASLLETLDTLPPETLTALRANIGDAAPPPAPAGRGRGAPRGARGRDPEVMMRTNVNRAARQTLQKHGAGDK